MDGTDAIDVYFEEQIEILVREAEGFPVEEADRILEELEVEFTSIDRAETV